MLQEKQLLWMNSSVSLEFLQQFAALSGPVRQKAKKQYALWLRDHWHPSLHFKRVGPYWSARVDRDHRVLGIETDGTIIWFYIGPHSGYERKINL
jgi:hypothetical protein